MAANYDLTLVHGPPSPAVPGILKKRLSEGYTHVYPSQLYKEHPGFGVRDIANHVLGLLRKHRSVVVEDTCVRGGVRDCLLKVIPHKLAACKTRVIEVRPQQGQQQTLWERQFILAARPQPHLVLSDEQIHCWFDPQGPESTSGCSPAAAGFKETVTVPLTAETNYKFEVAGLLVQWEGAVDSGGYLQGQMGAVCRHWAQSNPRGHVIVLCDGTAVARGHTSAAQQKSQIISCLKALATEAPCPVYGLQVTSTLDAGEFSLPPSPGLLAFLHRRHCLNLHHRSTVYVYSDMKHMKMAEKAGVRHIQVQKVLKNPQLLKTCHSATASPVPPMLQQLQLVAECRTATDPSPPLPAIPLADSLGTFTDHYVCVDHPRGLREFLFAQDTLQVERFQRQYADGAAPVGGEVGSGRGLARPEAERLEERDDDYLADTLVSDDQATLREVHESDSAAPRHIPAWMLRKKSSSVESDPTPATLEKSVSTSSVEGRGRSRHTIYIMTEKELLETAKDVLKQAGREDVIETCTLRSGEGGTAQSAKRDRGGGKVAPTSTASVTEDTDILGPTPTAATQHSGQQDTATCRVGDLTKVPGPPASRGCTDSVSTAAKRRRLSATPGKGEGGGTDEVPQQVSPQKSSPPQDCPGQQQNTDRRTEGHRKAPDLSVLDEIFF